MKKLLVTFFYTINLLACGEQNSETSQKQNNKVEQLISNIYQYDTLTLFARYSECGEWGGHTEIFKIYHKGKNEVWADYKKDSVNCKDETIHNIIYAKTLKLTQESQQLVIEYMHDLLNQNFLDKGLQSHAGNLYYAISSDSSLVISHYADHYNGFDKLRDNIIQ